ncbi:non-homologous end joining protein Ku [Pseudarthrobacter albicanus]|uniref:non-homologous end joining protein Ku n=1 Tax=Pseudarthrobacter albicanus TaxID=2823873 RepID=UPI001BA62942|nr:Ku protein [Pseudarthrobacter albicanus]
MRSIWKGAIAFGLVKVPVKLYAATEDHDIGLHQVHDADGGRIHYHRRCEKCGQVVDYENIDKAYYDGERTVVLTDDDLASLTVEQSREIEVVEFVPSGQLDPVRFGRSYYLEPDSKSTKGYVLLRRTLEETDRTAIVKFSIRQKSRLGALRVSGNVMTLQSLFWDDEVRRAEFPALEETVRISPGELEMSAALVESFSSDFSPGDFTDEYREQLNMLIRAKLEKAEAMDTGETFGEAGGEEEDRVLELLEALRRSVMESRAAKNAGARSPLAGTAKTGASGTNIARAVQHKKGA